MDDKKCSFIKEDGTPCGAYRITDSLFCYQHDNNPAIQAERHLARQAGGLTNKKIKALSPETLGFVNSRAELKIVLNLALLDLVDLPNTTSRGRTIVLICNALDSLLIREEELSELQGQINVLKRQAGIVIEAEPEEVE